jgi:hypothetical protein
VTLKYTRRVYSGSAPLSKPPNAEAYAQASPATPLSSRTFGTWSLLSSIVRLYCAYHITNPVVYEITLWTYAVGCMHFTSEWLYFRSASWGAGLASPLIVAGGSIAWMLWCWEGYVGK